MYLLKWGSEEVLPEVRKRQWGSTDSVKLGTELWDYRNLKMTEESMNKRTIKNWTEKLQTFTAEVMKKENKQFTQNFKRLWVGSSKSLTCAPRASTISRLQLVFRDK